MRKLSSLLVLVSLGLTGCELCAGEGCDGDAQGCASFNQSGCEGDPRCTGILASPIVGEEPETWCLPSDPLLEYVGCMDVDEGCDDAMTIAVDLEDQAWEFTSSCTPEGWEEAAWTELPTCE